MVRWKGALEGYSDYFMPSHSLMSHTHVCKGVGRVDESENNVRLDPQGELWWCYVPGPGTSFFKRRLWRGYKEYTQEDVDRAIALVHDGASLVEAEKTSRVPDASIRRFLKKCTAHAGPCKGANLRAAAPAWDTQFQPGVSLSLPSGEGAAKETD